MPKSKQDKKPIEPEVTVPETESVMEELKQQISTLDLNWKRALADYQNLQRRVENDKKELGKLANVNLIARLIPALDIIEISGKHSQDIGVQMAAKQFHQALFEEGLQIIEPETGSIFDPNFQECGETIESNDKTVENTVSELVLKGYKIGDYVLRPAKVKVYKYIETK